MIQGELVGRRSGRCCDLDYCGDSTVEVGFSRSWVGKCAEARTSEFRNDQLLRPLNKLTLGDEVSDSKGTAPNDPALLPNTAARTCTLPQGVHECFTWPPITNSDLRR